VELEGETGPPAEINHLSQEVSGFDLVFSDLAVECISKGQHPKVKSNLRSLLIVVVCEEVKERHRPNLLLLKRGYVCFPFHRQQEKKCIYLNLSLHMPPFVSFPKTPGTLAQYFCSSNGLTS
jgi:hypothetical protein